jgi:hypothetical protein
MEYVQEEFTWKMQFMSDEFAHNIASKVY